MSGDSVQRGAVTAPEVPEGGERTNGAAHDSAPAAFEQALSSVAVASMLACIAVAIGQFVGQIVDTWPAMSFTVLAFVVSLEAIYSQRLLERRGIESTDRFRYRFVEGIVLALLVRFAVYADYGYPRFLSDLAAWSMRAGSFFDLSYILTLLLMLGFWLLAGLLARSLDELHATAIERMPSVTDPNHYLRSTMPEHGRIDRRLRLRRITTVFWTGGGLLILLAGLGRVPVQELVLFRHTRSSGVVLNVLVYFVIGLLLLSQAHYRILRANWDLEDIPISGELAKRWSLMAIGVLVAVGLVAAVLPVGYSVGILETVGTAVRWIIYALAQVVFLFLFAISYGLGLLLSLFTGKQNASPPPVSRAQIPPSPPAELANDPNPWWALIRSLVFWTILLGVVGYSLFQYARDRWGFLGNVSLGAIVEWIRRLLGRGRRGLARMGKSLAAGLQTALVRRRREETTRRGFLSLRRLTPRQRVRYYYVSVLKRSDRAGFGRGLAQTPLEYQETLSRELPDVAADVHELTARFCEARYSEHPVDAHGARETQTVWQRVKRSIVSRIRGAPDRGPTRGQ